MQNEYYLGNPLVKRDGVVQDWTQDELKEYLIKSRGIQESKIKVIYHFSSSEESPRPENYNKEIIYTGNLGIP